MGWDDPVFCLDRGIAGYDNLLQNHGDITSYLSYLPSF